MTGEQLKKRREALGQTQVQLAKRMDIHPISLSRFERGVDPIPVMMELALRTIERESQPPPESRKPAKKKR